MVTELELSVYYMLTAGLLFVYEIAFVIIILFQMLQCRISPQRAGWFCEMYIDYVYMYFIPW